MHNSDCNLAYAVRPIFSILVREVHSDEIVIRFQSRRKAQLDYKFDYKNHDEPH